MKDWHSSGVDSVYSELNSGSSGISTVDAASRLEKYGKNALSEKKKKGALSLFLEQFTDFLVLLLIVAAIISFALGLIENEQSNFIDAALILAIVIANAVLGFIQEYNAEKSLEALKRLSSTTARVIRSGELFIIDAQNLVPGDIIIVEEGDKIPADARI